LLSIPRFQLKSAPEGELEDYDHNNLQIPPLDNEKNNLDDYSGNDIKRKMISISSGLLKIIKKRL